VTGIETILIIKWGALGDLIAATPAIKAVREHFPHARLTLLSNSLMMEICPPGSIVDEVLVYDYKRLSAFESLFQQTAILKKLRSRKFDLAINLRWESERSALLTWLSGAHRRVGSGPKSLRSVYTTKAKFTGGKYHEIHRNTDIVKALGIAVVDETPYVSRSRDDDSFADDFFGTRGLKNKDALGLHPGASKSEKMWPAERFIQVGKAFIESFRQPVLVTWGPGELDLARRVAGSLGPRAILSEQTETIGRLAAVIQRCGMFLCNCTGPMNVAMAARTPVVALLGSSDPEEWGPYGPLHRTVKSGYVLDSYTPQQEQRAMEGIGVDEVWNAVRRRWSELYPQTVGVAS